MIPPQSEDNYSGLFLFVELVNPLQFLNGGLVGIVLHKGFNFFNDVLIFNRRNMIEVSRARQIRVINDRELIDSLDLVPIVSGDPCIGIGAVNLSGQHLLV